MNVAAIMEKSEVVDYYRQMLLIRTFEENAQRVYMQGKIRGFLHLYIGQEAIAVGAISTLNDDDYVIGHHRAHGHALAKGVDPKAIMAELYGKATGTNGGKGGSMHVFDASRYFMGGHAIVGGQLPIAVGLALAIKRRKENRVVICFFGDGAVSEGEFHESMNMASLWKLPVIFLLENNFYGMGSHVEQVQAAGKDLYLMAEPYKMPAVQVDGMDIIAVREATTAAVNRIRIGNGPVFIEALTYRYRGHSVADPSNYRESEEVAEWREKDPIERFKATVIEDGLLTQEEVDEAKRDIEAIVAEAITFAEESPEPSPEALYENVYA